MLATHEFYPPRLSPANDNRQRPVMIGLTGRRNVGKSTVANLLVEEYGFERVHPYEGGKVAFEAFLTHLTTDADIARRMVWGDLKDVPSHYLPGEVSPRYFMERDGRFRGETLGVEWTLGIEIAAARRRNPRAPIVVESIVYEAPWFRAQGGRVVRLERPGHDGPSGIETDAVVATLAADDVISATSVPELQSKARRMVQAMVGGG